MGTIRVQQTDNATLADSQADQNKLDAAAATGVDDLKVVVEANSDSTISLVLAVQRLEGLVERIIDRNDGGRLSL
jgi:hypothetical protein